MFLSKVSPLNSHPTKRKFNKPFATSKKRAMGTCFSLCFLPKFKIEASQRDAQEGCGCLHHTACVLFECKPLFAPILAMTQSASWTSPAEVTHKFHHVFGCTHIPFPLVSIKKLQAMSNASSLLTLFDKARLLAVILGDFPC